MLFVNKKVVLASSLLLAAISVWAEAMEPFVPVMWRRGEVEETANDLKEIARQSGLRRFFIAGPGFNEVMYAPFATNLYADMGREIGAVAQRVAADGIEVGWWCSPSIRYVSNFSPIEDAFGHKSADNKKCPLDPAFQADWAAKVKAVVAAARPRMINIEDDYTLAWGRGLNNGGCFCGRHLELFAKIFGRYLSAAEIADAFADRTDDNLPIRRAFADTVRESLCLLAKKVRAAVDEVDPTVRICVCEPGANADKDGASVEAIARAFAGSNTRAAIRPSGAIYGAQTTPADVPGALAHTFYTIERLPKDIELFYEADPYPHNRFFASASQMGSFMSGAVVAGAENLLLYCLQYLDDPFEDKGYANEFGSLKKRLEAVRDFNVSRRATLNGVRVVWTSDALALTRGLGGGRDAQLADGAFLLAKFGVPYTMRSNAKGPVLLMGNIVSSLSDAEISKMLSGAAIVDAPAADELVKRGFGREIGVDVEIAKGRLPVIREEILPAAGLKRRGKEVNAFYIFSAGTEGTVRTFATLKPHDGTEVWSRFYGVGGVEVTPSLTVAKNARGGRVAVVATSLVGNRSSGLFNLRKQEMWRNLLCRIAPDAIDVVALDAPGIWVLTSVSEDGREMMVMVNNLSGDVRDNVSFALSKEWAGATVSRIGADGCKEKGERVSSRWTPNTIFSQMRPEFYLFSR
jgi:hypothetical protein